MENMRFCQSCGMPLVKQEDFGTNKDQSENADYCTYCFKDGMFTADCTMDEMIDSCVVHMKSAHPSMSEEEARSKMKAFLPNLKRWRTN